MLDLFGIRRRMGRAAGLSGAPALHTHRHSVHPGWPESTQTVLLATDYEHVQLRLRPLFRSDFAQWQRMRLEDQDILQAVEPTVPGSWSDAHSRKQWWQQLLQLKSAADAGSVVPMAIEVNGMFAGQLTLGGIQHGAGSDCWIGYWVYSGFTGYGVATAAVGLGVDHALKRIGVHRIVATYLPDNTASGRVLEKNGFRQEGYLRRNLHINGRWQDHYLVALCDDDYPFGGVEQLRRKGLIL